MNYQTYVLHTAGTSLQQSRLVFLRVFPTIVFFDCANPNDYAASWANSKAREGFPFLLLLLFITLLLLLFITGKEVKGIGAS
jgi:hypothetical protein